MNSRFSQQSSTGHTQKRRRTKKIFLWPAGVFLLFYAGWLLYFIFITPPLRRTPDSSSHPEKEEWVGVYHLHSRFSDGRGKVDDIVRAAKKNGLDFIILTDHGRPNFSCLRSQGWRQGILVLSGSELSTNRGHLVGIGFAEPDFLFPSKAEEAALLIQKQGGLAIIAHPFSKISWSWGRNNDSFHGLELMDADTMLKKNWPASFPFLPFLLLNPRLFVLRFLDPFPQPFQQWDSLNQKRPSWYGFFSCDAHLLYKPLLSLFHLRIPAEASLPAEFAAARHYVFEALRQGNFYNAIDAAQPAEGFRFWAERGEERWPMGSQVQFSRLSPVTLHLQIPLLWPTATSLLHNGKQILISPEKEIRYLAREPGVYRVEVFFQGKSLLPREIPWIVSNPIFLKAGET